ncbi:MAG: hypothetical protein HY096_07550 [Nitrospinae bacterium]|nr:hypothetical protein [Nitrospinota bacterium]
MGTEYTYSIEVWGEVFRQFRQVERARVDSSAERLDVTIRDRKDILQVSCEELDDILYKFNGNPKEVVTYYLKNNGVIVYYQNTLVGFFDIIGYSSFIEKEPIEEAIRKTSTLFKNTGNSARTDIYAVKLDHWILSDAVIIVVDTNRHPLFSGSLEVFLGTCSMIIEGGMRNKFPLRGAVGGGDFYKDGEIMVSSALVDAASYEKKQEWLGAVLTPKALKLIEEAKELEIGLKGETRIDFSSDRFNHFVRYGAIPWKHGESNETYYIKPFDMAEEDWAHKYLPDHFDREKKKEMIDNSHCLYSQK